MIVLKDAYKTNTSIAKCIKKYNLPPFDINANLNAAKRINHQQQQNGVVVAVAVAVAVVGVAVVFVVVFLAKQTISKWRTLKSFLPNAFASGKR